MPSTILVGKRIEEIELLDLFPANEGQMAQYYGRIGSGKTYAATSDVLDDLRMGRVVYINWPIAWEGFDQRNSLPYIILSIMFPWRNTFFYFPKENLRYFEFSDVWAQKEGYEDFTHWLSTRTDCIIYGDEGHVMFDSYQGTRMSIEKRTAVLHTRHFNRTINIISQRPTAIHVAMRANINTFYKCEKIFQFGPIVRFKRTEYQDMLNESVDEDPDKEVSRKYYWGRKKVFMAYNTRYLRGEMGISQKVMFQAYKFNIFARFALLLSHIFGK